MNYKIVSRSICFDVLETKTNQVINSFNVYEEAKQFLRHLNLGGGFDGYTPHFFSKKTKKLVKNLSPLTK
jgi:diaminopimelate decarboxylase